MTIFRVSIYSKYESNFLFTSRPHSSSVIGRFLSVVTITIRFSSLPSNGGFLFSLFSFFMQVYRSGTDDYQSVIWLKMMADQWDQDFSNMRKYYPWITHNRFVVDGIYLSLPQELINNQSNTVEPIVFLGSNKNWQPYIIAYGIVNRTQDEAMRIIGDFPEVVQCVSHMRMFDPASWELGNPESKKVRAYS